MAKKRIDLILVERGLCTSRERAQALIMAGDVLVADVPVTKPGTSIDSEALIRLKNSEHPYVSRGALKLLHALKEFQLNVTGAHCIDVGASTGGFTEVLLDSGATRVLALDVGHNQLDWKLRTDPRVVLKEGVNARYLELKSIIEWGFESPRAIVVDVSFISLDKILGPLSLIMTRQTDLVTLIKPQFEVGRNQISRGGIVKNDDARNQILEKLHGFGLELGLEPIKTIDSPITGTDGNHEFLCHWKKRKSSDTAS